MITYPESPPITGIQEKSVNQATESINSKSSKSLRKIDRAVKKIQTLKEDTSK